MMGLTGVAALEAEMRDRLAAKDAEIARLNALVERLKAAKGWEAVCDSYADENQRLSDQVEGKPIAAAPKDGSRILVRLKNPLPVQGRDDLEYWHGVPFVARHPGVSEDGFDIGWGFAAPVGQGGFPDDWIECWWPLPFSSDKST